MNPMTNGVAGLLVHLLGSSDLLDRAILQDGHPVGEFQRLVLIVRDEDRRLAGPLVNFAQPPPQILAHLRVERAEWLVEKKHPGLDRQRPGERDALALAAR